MSRRTQKIVILVAALALILPFGAAGLVGALGGSDGASDPSASASADDQRARVDPASQPRPAPTAMPAPPEGMDVQSAEGAQATLVHLLDAYAPMMATGDTSVWSEHIDPACAVCVQFVATAEQLHSQGGWSVGGEFTVTGTSFEAVGDPPASGVVTVDFVQAEQVIVDDPARTPLTQSGVTARISARMAWDGSRWRVGDMTLETAPGTANDGGA